MKSVLISIQPKWCELIANGEKTIEVRKTRPKLETPFKCYIYCTKAKNKWSLCDYEGAYQNSEGEIVYAQQRIIGDFVCDKVEKFAVGSLRSDDIEKLACLSYAEMINYFYKPEELDGNTSKFGYGWHISDLKIYDTPKELNEFESPCSYKGTCYYCARAKFESDGTFLCNTEINRAPQSWCYVEELKEKQK